MRLEIRLGPFVLNPDTRQLTRDGSEIHISRKAFERLTALVAARPKVVTKAALQERLWPGTFVVDANLSNLIAEIRDALGDEPRSPRFIRTSHGFGYAFSAEVVTAPPVRTDAATAPTMTSWLECQGRKFPLARGENVIGRDPDLAISLIAPTASRRHARVIVIDDGATVEDFGSKNGTFVGGLPVRPSAPLAHDDVIHFGTLPARFYVGRDDGVTETAVKSPVERGAHGSRLAFRSERLPRSRHRGSGWPSSASSGWFMGVPPSPCARSPRSWRLAATRLPRNRVAQCALPGPFST